MIVKANNTDIIEFFTSKDRSLTDEELKFFEESDVEVFRPTFSRSDRAKLAAMMIGGQA